MNGSKRNFQILNLSDQNDNGRPPVDTNKSGKSTTETIPSTSTNSDSKQGQDSQPDKGTKENKTNKSFAQTFAFLQTSDMYKLSPKPVIATQPVVPKSTNSIIVNARQRGNPILKHVRNVPWEYGEIIPDYQLGERQCALFLSLRYHNLNPDYIHERLKLLGNNYDLRVILVHVDIKHCKHNLKELGKIGLLAGCTLILTWSAEEAGRYLETYKQYENKPPDILQERVETDYFAKIQDVLTTIKSINKTDAITLLSTFGSLQNIINASKDEIVLCPGFGEQKAQRLHKVFHEPFKRTSINVTPNQQPALISCEVGQLPSTSKLKRPSENIYLQKRKSSPPHKLKRHNSDNQMVASTKSSSLSKSALPTLDKLEHSTLILQKEVVRTLSTSDEDGNAQTGKLTAKNNNSSADKLVQQKNTQQSSKTTDKSITYHKMSKSEAVYKSGLSRNRKETENVLNYTSGHAKKSTNEAEKMQNSQVNDKKSHYVKNYNLPSSQAEQKSNKITTPPCNTGKTGTINLDKSNVCSNTFAKNSATISVPSNTTPKKVVAADSSPSLNNRDLLEGKIRAKTRRKSESTTTNYTESEKYSTQLTNDEFMDLLADDLDQDDDDDII